MKRAIFFDLFHTLIDVGQVPDFVGEGTAEMFDFDPLQWSDAVFSDLHEIRKTTDHFTMVKTLARSINSEVKDSLIKEVVKHRQLRFNYALLNINSEVLETLEMIKSKGLKIVLISNASTAEVLAWKDSPLAAYFDLVLFSCELGYAKPEPEIYQHALNHLALEPGDCLYVGDGGSNELEGAKKMGLETVMVNQYLKGLPSSRLQQRRQYSDHEIVSLSPLLSIVNLV